MQLKKTKNSYNTMSQSASFGNFRTVIKSRASKETVHNVVHLSATIQESLDQDDKRSVRSTYSVSKKSESGNDGNDRLKSFVRNMKISKDKFQQPASFKIPNAIQNRDLSNSRSSIHSIRSNRSQL